MLSGLAVGWTVNTGFIALIEGFALLLLFAFAMSWVGVWLGLTCRPSRSPSRSAFIVLFPITFVSNVFVPLQTLPTWLQPFAEWNPTSTLTSSLRRLWGNPDPFPAAASPSTDPIL